jgi:hypothetical protein
MKTTLIALAATLAFSALPAAHAQTETSMQQVQVSGRYLVTPEDFTEFANTYRLTNGQKVKFSQSGDRYFAQVDTGKRVRIVPVANQEFMTADGAYIAFRSYGEEVAITNFDKLPMAQPQPANTLVVARR